MLLREATHLPTSWPAIARTLAARPGSPAPACRSMKETSPLKPGPRSTSTGLIERGLGGHLTWSGLRLGFGLALGLAVGVWVRDGQG